MHETHLRCKCEVMLRDIYFGSEVTQDVSLMSVGWCVCEAGCQQVGVFVKQDVSRLVCL